MAVRELIYLKTRNTYVNLIMVEWIGKLNWPIPSNWLEQRVNMSDRCRPLDLHTPKELGWRESSGAQGGVNTINPERGGFLADSYPKSAFSTLQPFYHPQTKFGARWSFYACLSLCSQGAGVSLTETLWTETPWTDSPLNRHPHGQRTPLTETPIWQKPILYRVSPEQRTLPLPHPVR